MIIIENSTADIFSLIAFLFFFIIMPILRANKKKNQEGQQPAKKKPKSLQEMIKEAMQADEQDENNDPLESDYPIQETLPTPSPEKILDDEPKTLIGEPAFKSNLQLFMEEKARQQESNRIFSTLEQTDTAEEKEAFAPEENNHDSIEFDAKEAMIYHEIFSKPKFFDY